MTNYEIGFLNKCAEHGLDADVSMALLEKTARGKIPPALVLHAAKRQAGETFKKNVGNAVRGAAKAVGDAVGRVGKTVAEKSRSARSAISDKARKARRAVGEYADNVSGAKVRRAYKEHAKSFMEYDAFKNPIHDYHTTTVNGKVIYDSSKLNKTKLRNTNVERVGRNLEENLSRTRKKLDEAVKARNKARIGTAAGVTVVGGGGAIAATRGGKKGGQEKKSEAYFRGFAEKCAEYGLDAGTSMELLEKRSQLVGGLTGYFTQRDDKRSPNASKGGKRGAMKGALAEALLTALLLAPGGPHMALGGGLGGAAVGGLTGYLGGRLAGHKNEKDIKNGLKL